MAIKLIILALILIGVLSLTRDGLKALRRARAGGRAA
jgi:hypothetical protein